MISLELLAPARNADIGIAAIDCGADAVYIAGPKFGARQAAGNSIEDISRLCGYAKKFGARVFITLNTILYDSELQAAAEFMKESQEAGVSAFIVQDLAVIRLAKEYGITVPLHASTQCAISTVESAKFYNSLGFSRLILERQLSLEQIREISNSVDSEIEFFVHGAICVSHSGKCYLSEQIAGRSANRGACIQACGTKFDLVTEDGTVLLKDKAILSLKDYNLKSRIKDLAEAGVCSFKIEGRLKNISYVRNVVREYSIALDRLVAGNPDMWERASFGRITKGFSPDPGKTFNRGYTELFIDGNRGKWAAVDTPKSMGEPIGKILQIKQVGGNKIEIDVYVHDGVKLSNGDGFSVAADNEIIGFRGDICMGHQIICKNIKGLRPGMQIWRNISVEFEKSLENSPCKRTILVDTKIDIVQKGEDSYILAAQAVSEDGRIVDKTFEGSWNEANNAERMREILNSQINKKTRHYYFRLCELNGESLPFLKAAEINEIRRDLAELLDGIDCNSSPLAIKVPETQPILTTKEISYNGNVANKLAKQIYLQSGATKVDSAYEISHTPEAELMRSKYCVKYELNRCPKHHKCKDKRQLYLVNNGKKFKLGFDCAKCEMILTTQ